MVNKRYAFNMLYQFAIKIQFQIQGMETFPL